VADILTGVIAFLWPAITLLVLVFLVAFWAIVSGILLIAAAFRSAGRREWLFALGSVLSVLFGVLLLAPITGAVVRRVRGRLRRRHADRRPEVAPPAPACRAFGACR
jgi:uncharacterized membrane protein HdeD (DUF308 family)